MIEINFKNAVWFGIILVSAGISYGMVSQKLEALESKQMLIEKGIADVYGKETVASYYGDTKDDIRQSIVDNFMDSNGDLRFFIGNPKTGGYGLTLTSSHTVVYYSNDYSLEVRMQSEDRAHRIGQTNKVTYIDLIAEGTIDEKIVKSLNNKIDLASKVMGEDPKKILFA